MVKKICDHYIGLCAIKKEKKRKEKKRNEKRKENKRNETKKEKKRNETKRVMYSEYYTVWRTTSVVAS